MAEAASQSTGKAYAIVQTKSFRRDLKRLERSGQYNFRKLEDVIEMLASGRSLPPPYRDHELTGNLAGRRECHIEGNWLLIYRKLHDVLVLILLRTGTHADLFGE